MVAEKGSGKGFSAALKDDAHKGDAHIDDAHKGDDHKDAALKDRLSQRARL